MFLDTNTVFLYVFLCSEKLISCPLFSRFSLVKEHLIEFNQLAMANSEGSDNMLNRVMPKDNIGLAALIKTKEAAWENGMNPIGNTKFIYNNRLFCCETCLNLSFATWTLRYHRLVPFAFIKYPYLSLQVYRQIRLCSDSQSWFVRRIYTGTLSFAT